MNTVSVETTKEPIIKIKFKSGANNFLDNVIFAVNHLKDQGFETSVDKMGHDFKIGVY